MQIIPLPTKPPKTCLARNLASRFGMELKCMGPHLDTIFAELKRHLQVDLSGYRQDTFSRRLATRMEQTHCASIAEYRDYLRSDESEANHLIEAMAINVTSFFRNPYVWGLMEEVVIPSIIDDKKRACSSEIRVWSAGCGSGEEPYSIAILLCDALGDKLRDWTVQVFATDINARSLSIAQGGVYPREQFKTMQLGFLDRYCTQHNEEYEIKPLVREIVRFSIDDLTSSRHISPVESVFGEFDLVLCRNVLIYFDKELQNKVMSKLCASLAPGGYLVLGDSESIAGLRHHAIRTVDRRCRVGQKHA